MLNLSDGVKKALIIAPTEVLPARWRVGLRRRGLAKLELAKAARASFLIIGHPKSGNTWLKVMLSRLYQLRYDLPESTLINTDEFARRIPEIPRIAATNGCYSYEGEVGRLLAADAPDNPMRHKPVVFLARNPIDIAVSWYHQFTKRQSRAKQELINHAIETPIDRRKVQMWEFVRHSDIGLPFLIDYQNTWVRNIAALPHGLLVRYEDLRSDPVPTLSRILEHVGESFSDDEIRAAVEWGSFDNLQKLETSGTFRQGGMKLVNRNDPSTYKVRRGKVGGYREDFAPDQVEDLEALVRERIDPGLGYCRDDAKA
ncbi:sulfotransferase domain-containing protein [Chromatocurvus halotolerans]|uniref:Sulfotransferase domain-containing protein n=1 Tax=Chromatocurvus halotolerans TaxID=1132028 RepID=A0A4R2KTT9_9GAMM|nr:sulfotransferase domain-containing protein [Chromatocurvus halotolerans]TCO76272.1 sulfotransferase domain-containing protein [Chromatocurvus halotolerans]